MNRFSVTFKEEAGMSASFGTAFPVKGEKGDKGDSPVRGTDYWTPEDQEILLAEMKRMALGDIDTALEGIIALQENLIGGEGV